MQSKLNLLVQQLELEQELSDLLLFFVSNFVWNLMVKKRIKRGWWFQLIKSGFIKSTETTSWEWSIVHPYTPICSGKIRFANKISTYVHHFHAFYRWISHIIWTPPKKAEIVTFDFWRETHHKKNHQIPLKSHEIPRQILIKCHEIPINTHIKYIKSVCNTRYNPPHFRESRLHGDCKEQLQLVIQSHQRQAPQPTMLAQ